MSNLITQAKNVEKIFVNGVCGKLEVLKFNPSITPKKLAVVFHPDPKHGGTNTNKVVQTLAKSLCSQGVLVYCPNLRGVGESDGVHDFGVGEVADAYVIYQILRQNYLNLGVVLAGFSFGSYIAANLGQKVEYEKLVLIGTAVTRYQYPEVLADKTIVIHGAEDEIIEYAHVKHWCIEQNIPLTTFFNCGHFFHGNLVALSNYLKQIIAI